MPFVSWYAKDAAWNDAEFPEQPLPDRKIVVQRCINNIESGIIVMRVATEDATVHRLMLFVRHEPEGIHEKFWLWRPFVPYYYYLDFVKRVGIVLKRGAILFNDPFPEFERSKFPHIDVLRPLPDHMRQVTMFSRWRQHIASQKRAHVVKMCLLKLSRPDVLKVFRDADWL